MDGIAGSAWGQRVSGRAVWGWLYGATHSTAAARGLDRQGELFLVKNFMQNPALRKKVQNCFLTKRLRLLMWFESII